MSRSTHPPNTRRPRSPDRERKMARVWIARDRAEFQRGHDATCSRLSPPGDKSPTAARKWLVRHHSGWWMQLPFFDDSATTPLGANSDRANRHDRSPQATKRPPKACPERDSNPQGLLHQILSLARLPIPPSGPSCRRTSSGAQVFIRAHEHRKQNSARFFEGTSALARPSRTDLGNDRLLE